MMWLPTSGRIKVDKKMDRVAVELPIDIVQYYQWFIQRKYGLVIDQPTFGAHITLGYKKLHPKLDFDRAKEYHGRRVEFEYSNDIVVGGQRKGFMNFWVHVKSNELETIRRHIKAFDNKDFQGIHITIGNNKDKIGAEKQRREKYAKRRAPTDKYSMMAFWPPIIEIRK